MAFRKKHDITDIYRVRGKTGEESRLPELDTSIARNRNYHNYFRGYTEIQRKDEKGRIRIERYYTKPWIVSGLSVRKYWLLRLLYVLLTVLSAALYIVPMVQDVPGTRHWVVALPGMPSIILLFLLAAACVQYVTVPKKMTLWDHASSTRRIKYVSLATGIAQALTAASLAVLSLMTGREVGHSLLYAAGVLISAVCSGSIFFVERKVPYSEIPNDTILPEGEAYQIR
ncbi:MAG TPA: hypothetical protein GXZ52_05460 [Clostridiales bacterium]|nr:hypothetical protein [Clostridiales bacterium]